uniref:Uncharacterized protein n=1 Tax=Parascaris univalens TaxID=6257 RepID=A0A914ZNQ1_PARUN
GTQAGLCHGGGEASGGMLSVHKALQGSQPRSSRRSGCRLRSGIRLACQD